MAIYTDFDMSFERTANGDINALSDEGCIRQVIKNSVQMNSYDIPFNKWHAANIKNYLFEHPNKISESEIKNSIRDVLLLDPRLQNPVINITYSSDYQYCYIDITVYVVLLDKEVNQIIELERVR